MKRPGPVELAMLLAFAIPVVIEFRTLLAMFGIEVTMGTYLLVASLVLVAIFGLLMLLPEDEQGNPNPR